jgi:transposase
MKKEVLGIDISKLTIDVYLHVNQSDELFNNNPAGFRKLISWLKKEKIILKDLLVCFEHTGMYSFELANFLTLKNIDYVMESAIQIKRSMGVVRGKNDKIDAQRIADYAYRRRDKLEFSVLPSKMISKIQKLLSLRETMVKQRAGYKVTVQENSRILVKSEYKCFFEAQNKLVKSLTTQICKVEEEIKLIIASDLKLENTYNLITSISGVGFIVAAYFISTTSCFTKFKNGRKYACYCGTAPFEYSSGTSIHFKTRVNPMANKKMKSLLNMSARSAITCDPELKDYYHRKVEQGKNKMSTLNIIRNKIIHRVFAVVNRGTPYVVLQNHLS